MIGNVPKRRKTARLNREHRRRVVDWIVELMIRSTLTRRSLRNSLRRRANPRASPRLELEPPRIFAQQSGLALGSSSCRRKPLPARRIRTQKAQGHRRYLRRRRQRSGDLRARGQENIPHLLNEFVPQSSFFTHVSIKEFWAITLPRPASQPESTKLSIIFPLLPPEHPTVFEYFRKDLKRPASDTWVVAPSNGFNRIGESDCRSYGPGTGATVILPKHLLSAATSGGAADFDHLLRDNYENPLYTPQLAGRVRTAAAGGILRLSVADFMAHARTLSSPDEFSVYIAKRLMQQEAPSLLWITMHDIDVAHSGAYSLYIEGIRRTDRLCAELWKAVQTDPEYAGNTTLFVLPDFGRDSDYDAGGNGFQHHRTGDVASRTTWMMALGAGVRQGVVFNEPMQSIDLVPSLGAIMGFSPAQSQGKPVKELL